MSAAPVNRADPTDGRAAGGKDTSRVHFLVTILCDIVLPVALYYLLRASGRGEITSLLISGSAPALHTVYSVIRHRKIDSIGVFTVAILVLGALGSLITGSPRVALARNGAFTALAALWLLGTLFAARPFTYRALKALLPGKSDLLERLWETEASFRRVWRGLTVLWGCGLLVDAVLRVVMAYTLPVDTVPALDGALYAVTWLVLQVTTHVTLFRTGVFQMLFGKPRGTAKPPDDAEAQNPA
ncbi:VC0807 family protein [Peterkaempfera bronchialis]|uniref:VC0807 family protein n=1 Tax=Peterkaempfera bronchialis TaxID=2126346 RepID=UPI001588EA57|nr:VC0807 family protein [Peterkaempfera bronchialis]